MAEPTYEALDPLFTPSAVPTAHRRRAPSGRGAEVVAGRRPSPIAVVRRLRAEVDERRSSYYVGASTTSRELLGHWFAQEHVLPASDGRSYPFSYYFGQREAIETLVY